MIINYDLEKNIFSFVQKPIFPKKHPVNHLILGILIWLAPRYAIRQFTYSLTSLIKPQNQLEQNEYQPLQHKLNPDLS